MKKILSLLTAITLMASTTSNLVSCNQQKKQSNDDEILNSIKKKIKNKDLGTIDYQEDKTISGNLNNLKVALNNANNDILKDNELARITFENGNKQLIADGATQNKINAIITYGTEKVMVDNLVVIMNSEANNNNIINNLLQQIPNDKRNLTINYIKDTNWDITNNNILKLLRNKLIKLWNDNNTSTPATTIEKYKKFIHFNAKKPTAGNTIDLNVTIKSGNTSKSSIVLKMKMKTEQNTIDEIYNALNTLQDKKINIKNSSNKSLSDINNRNNINFILQKEKDIDQYSLPYLNYPDDINLKVNSYTDVSITIAANGGNYKKTIKLEIKMNPSEFIISKKNIPSGITSIVDRVIDVFGIKIYGCKGVKDSKMLFAANIMAEYLDNNEDGVVDDPAILKTMVARHSGLIMWNKDTNLDTVEQHRDIIQQDLGDEETRPEWHKNKTGQFDASLEEIWHIICTQGYEPNWPKEFSSSYTSNSKITQAMDKARGGKFKNIPSSYPAKAYYTYDDQTCEYSCQTTEYMYWVESTLLGAQANRGDEIQGEWKNMNTKELLIKNDYFYKDFLSQKNTIDSSKTNLEYYHFPINLPDGEYMPQG